MIRKFNKLSEAGRIRLLMKGLMMACEEHGYMKWRTDVYGIANQYLRIVRKSDFELIKEKTVGEVDDMIGRKEIDKITGGVEFDTIKGKTIDELIKLVLNA